jgi:hypothetical protein
MKTDPNSREDIPYVLRTWVILRRAREDPGVGVELLAAC